MWKETKLFSIDASLKDVIRWAYARHNNTEEKWLDGNASYDIKNFRFDSYKKTSKDSWLLYKAILPYFLSENA
jgi:hypothetical protein